jgi:hypothetical protein
MSLAFPELFLSIDFPLAKDLVGLDVNLPASTPLPLRQPVDHPEVVSLAILGR